MKSVEPLLRLEDVAHRPRVSEPIIRQVDAGQFPPPMHGDAMLDEGRIPASIESQTMAGLTFDQLQDFATASVSRIWIRDAGHRTGTNRRLKSTSMPNVR